MLREGLEAALIVGILLACLSSIGRKDHARRVWLGVAAAVTTSVLVAGVLFFTVSGFEGRAEEIFEGIASLTAVAFLTWMIFWMRRHAVNLKRQLHDKVEEALRSPRIAGVAAIAFLVVVREGIETALFFFATVREAGTGVAAGGLLGLGVALALGVGIYEGGLRLNLRTFFTLTGGFLLVVAGGLAAYGVHELIEASVIPAGIDHVWDVSTVLPDGSGLGAILKGIFGYNANPALTELLVWLGYLTGVGTAFFTPVIRVRRAGLSTQKA